MVIIGCGIVMVIVVMVDVFMVGGGVVGGHRQLWWLEVRGGVGALLLL